LIEKEINFYDYLTMNIEQKSLGKKKSDHQILYLAKFYQITKILIISEKYITSLADIYID
jgi:hypothetical protein